MFRRLLGGFRVFSGFRGFWTILLSFSRVLIIKRVFAGFPSVLGFWRVPRVSGSFNVLEG